MVHTVVDALLKIEARLPSSFVVRTVSHPDRVDVSVDTDGTLTDNSGTVHLNGSFPGNEPMALNGQGQVDDDELDRVIDTLVARIRRSDGNGYLKGIL